MNLYLISRPDKVGYDEYDSAVVAAKSIKDASTIHPASGRLSGYEDWDGDWDRDSPGVGSCWIPAEHVQVKYIGKAVAGTKRGVICASFNAG